MQVISPIALEEVPTEGFAELAGEFVKNVGKTAADLELVLDTVLESAVVLDGFAAAASGFFVFKRGSL